MNKSIQRGTRNFYLAYEFLGATDSSKGEALLREHYYTCEYTYPCSHTCTGADQSGMMLHLASIAVGTTGNSISNLQLGARQAVPVVKAQPALTGHNYPESLYGYISARAPALEKGRSISTRLCKRDYGHGLPVKIW